LHRAGVWPKVAPGHPEEPQIGRATLKRIFGKGEPAEPPARLPDAALPVIWLLGKTGAGKSSLVQALTGQSDAEIGRGFQPCTRSALAYDFPPDQPLLRFLDTRGLGEAAYDPAEDLAACRTASHVVMVVCRLDDPVQGEVAEALADVTKAEPGMRAILVLTGRDLLPDAGAASRARGTIAATMARAARRDLPVAEIALPRGASPDAEGLAEVRRHLLAALPAAGLLLARERITTAEEAAFETVKPRVLFYAGIAGVSDVAPVLGAVSVPATQVAMLRELGARYGVPWERNTLSAFLGALGLGIGARFAGSFGLRQLAKLIPVYGQSVGAVAAGSVSFATTYALGRVAAYFLHHRAAGRLPDEAELRATYARAFERSSDDPA
jgi:uncharacterized protein (DUF697 family)